MKLLAKNLLLVLCVSVFLISCEEDGEDTSFRGVIPVGPSTGEPDPTGDPEPEPEKVDEIWPLAVGNRWIQETKDRFGAIDTIWSEVTRKDTMVVDGKLRIVYVMDQSSGSGEQFFFCDSLGMTQAYEGASYLSVKFPIEEGESFTYDHPLGSPGTITCVDTDKQLTMYDGTTVSTYVYVLGDITGGQLVMHYAPNIGPILINHLFAGQFLAEQRLIEVELY